MKKSKEIKLLQELLDRIPNLKQLNHNNDEYQKLLAQVRVTLEYLFGKYSNEYKRFQNSLCFYEFHPFGTEDVKQQDYLFSLNAYESSLKYILERQKTKEKLNKALRVKRFLRFIKERLIIKIGYEVKDFITSIIAKFLAEKSK